MKHRFINMLLIFVFILFGRNELNYSQMEISPQVYFRFFKYPFVNDFEKSGLRVFIQVPYNDLLFVKSEDFFTANYEIEIIIRDEVSSVVLDETFEQSFSVVEYEETNSDSLLSLWERKFQLKPNKYEVEMILTDKNSNKFSKGKMSVEIQKYDESKVCISDILFLDRIEFLPNEEIKLIPSHKNNTRINNKKYFTYFEMYFPSEDKEVKIRYSIFDEFSESDKPIKEGTMLVTKKKKYDYFYTDLIDLNLQMGRYLITYEIKQGEEQVQASSYFSVGWEGLPESVKDFDEAIEQLKYIASGKEMKKIKEKNGNEKLKAFKEFWDKRDPSPDVSGNEKMTEYYRRINFAKKNFSNARGNIAGWLSDRGYIFVLMGAPDEIYTQHSYSSDAYPYNNPYEIWYYYNKRRDYIFIDETGFGDYTLASPIYYEDSDMIK